MLSFVITTYKTTYRKIRVGIMLNDSVGSVSPGLLLYAEWRCSTKSSPGPGLVSPMILRIRYFVVVTTAVQCCSPENNIVFWTNVIENKCFLLHHAYYRTRKKDTQFNYHHLTISQSTL